MGDILIAVVIIAIVSLAALYVCKAKKRGVRCIGCPDSAKCSDNFSGCSGHCGSCGRQK